MTQASLNDRRPPPKSFITQLFTRAIAVAQVGVFAGVCVEGNGVYVVGSIILSSVFHEKLSSMYRASVLRRLPHRFMDDWFFAAVIQDGQGRHPGLPLIDDLGCLSPCGLCLA